jgi:hypothetical protein
MEYSDKDLLQISLKRGELITYKRKSFTDYMVRGDLFVVINGTQWIGIYNMDCVEYVAYIPEDRVEQ